MDSSYLRYANRIQIIQVKDMDMKTMRLRK